jgi:hypothetical protein
MEINRKVLDHVTQFPGSTDLSFRTAAGDAPFKFVSDID